MMPRLLAYASAFAGVFLIAIGVAIVSIPLALVLIGAGFLVVGGLDLIEPRSRP
jgi:hypothetical protein